jgi:hypothetical protein
MSDTNGLYLLEYGTRPEHGYQEFDKRLAEVHAELGKNDARQERILNQMHVLLGDERRRAGRRHDWQLSTAEARLQVRQAIRYSTSSRQVSDARELNRADSETRDDGTRLRLIISSMDDIYLSIRWSRFFPCANRDGHIHRSLHGCSTIRFTTHMQWRPDLSGKTDAEAVAELGEALCTFCFPEAPSAWKAKTLGQVRDERTAGERAAAKAARLEAKYIRALRPAAGDDPGEIFRVENGLHERVETVAAAKDILRREVELRDYFGRGEHSWHAAYVLAAGQARAVLLRREGARPGTGATLAQIDRIVANAVRRSIRNGARLNPDGSVKN